MLWEIDFQKFGSYGTAPQPYDKGVLLTSSEGKDPFWGYPSARLDSLPPYKGGDMLQWAMLVEVLTPPMGIRFSVQNGYGDENELGVLPRPSALTPVDSYFLTLPSKKAWVTTEPVIVSSYKRTIYFFTNGPNQAVVFYRLLLGEPKSIKTAITPNVPWGLFGMIIPIVAIAAVVLAKRKK